MLPVRSQTMNNQKWDLTNKDKSAAKNRKVIMLEVKFKWHLSWVMEEIADRADCGVVDMGCCFRNATYTARGI